MYIDNKLYQAIIKSSTNWKQLTAETETIINRTIPPPYNNNQYFLRYFLRTRSQKIREAYKK